MKHRTPSRKAATLAIGTSVALATAVLAGGVWAYMRRLLPSGTRAAAAALAVFFFSPVLPLLLWSGVHLSLFDHLTFLFTSGEGMPAWHLWGYLHTVLAVGLMPVCLLGIERAMDPARRRPA